jgi:hypothetical protein
MKKLRNMKIKARKARLAKLDLRCNAVSDGFYKVDVMKLKKGLLLSQKRIKITGMSKVEKISDELKLTWKPLVGPPKKLWLQAWVTEKKK